MWFFLQKNEVELLNKSIIHLSNCSWNTHLKNSAVDGELWEWENYHITVGVCHNFLLTCNWAKSSRVHFWFEICPVLRHCKLYNFIFCSRVNFNQTWHRVKRRGFKFVFKKKEGGGLAWLQNNLYKSRDMIQSK